MVEPDFGVESELETALVALAQGAARSDSVVMRGFGLGIAVFTAMSGGTVLRLIEVKAFSPRHGRCGFGHGKGGNQVRLLWDEAINMPRPASGLSVLDRSIRWVIGHRGRSIGEARYAFLNCTQVQQAASGGVRPGKYNNIRVGDLTWLTWHELKLRVEEFLSAP